MFYYWKKELPFPPLKSCCQSSKDATSLGKSPASSPLEDWWRSECVSRQRGKDGGRLEVSVSKWCRFSLSIQWQRGITLRNNVGDGWLSAIAIRSLPRGRIIVWTFVIDLSLAKKCQKKKQARPFPTLFGHRPRLYRWCPSRPFKIQDSTQTQEMCQDTPTIKKISVAPLHLYGSMYISLVHCRFPSLVSHVSPSASRRTGRPICIKTSRCALDQTLRDRRLTSLRTSWSWKCYFKATLLGSWNFSHGTPLLESLYNIQNISFRVLGNPSERTWPTSIY